MTREKILVVEDEPDVLDLCKQILASQGYQVKCAGDGYEAIERVKGESFDLVLTDIKMPGINGMEAYQAIKEFNPDIIGVIITGYASIEAAIEAVKLGFDGFVTKPFTPDELNAAVAKALGRASLERENARLRALIPLFELSEAFMTTIDLDELLDQVVHTAQRETKADRVSLMLLDEASGELTIEAAVGLNMSVVAEAREKVGEGIAGWVAERGEALLLGDKVSLDPKIREAMTSDKISSALCVPLKVKENRVIGVLNLSKLGGTPFAGTDLELVSILCGQAAIAIENARLFEEEKRRSTQLALINEVGGKAASILDLDRLMQEVPRSIQEKFNYYNMALFFLDEERREVVMQAVAGGFEHMAPGEYRQSLDEGIIGFVVRTGKSWLASDVSQNPYYVKGFLEEVLTKSELCIPVKLGDKVIGALDMQSIQLNDFDQSDVTAMEAVADQLAIAIENARLFEEARRRLHELESLVQANAAIISTLELHPQLENILSAAMAVVPAAEKGSILLLDEATGELAIQTLIGYSDPRIRSAHFPRETGYSAKALREGRPLLIPDAHADPSIRYDGEIEEIQAILSAAVVPLQVKGRITGVIALDNASRKAAFNEDDLRLLTTFADQAAIAIENARLYEVAQQELAERRRVEDALRKAEAEIRKRLREQIALREAIAAISSALDLDTVLSRIIEHMGQAVDATSAYICKYEPGAMASTVLAEYVSPQACAREQVSDLGATYLEESGEFIEAMQAGQHCISHVDDPDLSESERAHMQQYGAQTVLFIPLLIKGQLSGHVELWESRERREFTSEEIALCQGIVRQAAVAIENARLYERAQQEITERKQAEEALRESEERYRDLIESTYDIIQSVALDGRFVFVNRAWLETLGYTEAELPSLNLWKIIHPESLLHCREAFSRVMAGESIRNVQATFVAKDGRAILVEGNVTGRYIGGRLVATHGFFRDITERKRAEEQILSLAAKLKAIARSARQMSALLDLDELTQQVVRSLQEVTGCYNANFFLLEDDGLVLAAGRGGYEDGKPPLGYRLSVGQGIIGHVAQTGQPVLVSDVSQDPRYMAWEELPHTRSELAVPVKRGDEVLGVVDMQAIEPNAFDDVDLEALGVLADQLAVALDNTRLYEETRQLAAFNESIVQSMAEGIAVEDADGYFTFVNPAAAAMLGYAPEELLGQHWTAVTPPDQHSIVRAIDERRMRGEADRYEFELVRKDGRRLSALVSGSPRFEEGRFAGTLAVFTDITQRKRAERSLQALNQAALAMERALTPEEIFTAIAGEFRKLGFSCMVFPTDESQSRLFTKYMSYKSGALNAVEKLIGLKHEDFSISVEDVDLYRKVVWERKTLFVESAEEVLRQVLPEPIKRFAGQMVSTLKVPRAITAPLIVEDRVMGVLSVQSGDLTEGDIPAITAFAHQMAAAWRKATLLQDLERSLAEVERAQEELQHSYAQLRKTFEGTIHVLVSAIEMRDPYTAGHQRRVADLARAIATEMGLSREQIEGIRIAAVIHDIGKIAVPAEILSKPGPLTDLQYGLIQAHSQVGHDILNGTIEFPWPVAQIVLQHHERMDGSGYPQGLSGEEILLEARILAVADVVEAMSSHRPYRPARGIDEALDEISQNKGALYDPEVVDACLKLFNEKGFKFK